MTKFFCDHCKRELDPLDMSSVNLVDAYCVLKIDFSDSDRTSCDLCTTCRQELKKELAGVLKKFSGEN